MTESTGTAAPESMQTNAGGETLTTADLASATTSPGSSAEAGQTQVETRSVQETEGRDNPTPLFPSDETQTFQSRWRDIQSAFVDNPQEAVKQADALVAECMKRLADLFSTERGTLEDQWSSGADVSTEDLRVALQRYRSFFDRLLSV